MIPARSRVRARLRRLPMLMGAACFGVLAQIMPGEAEAQNMIEALARTYETNPEFSGAQAQLRATNELVAQALAAYRPTVTGTGSISGNYSNTVADPVQGQGGITSGGGGDEFVNPASVGIDVDQTLWAGGGRRANVNQAEHLILAERANVLAVEQDVLLAAATAYMDVVEAQAVLELRENNLRVLQRQMQAAQDRFAVGEATRTDTSQALGRVAGARAAITTAEGDLSAARATFQRVIGAPPTQLEPPVVPVNLPRSLEEAIGLAQTNNPRVIQADYLQRAADADIGVQEADLLPTILLRGSASSTFWPSDTVDRQDELSVTAQISIPLYQGGAAASRVREARETANARMIEIEQSRRTSIEDAIRAWEDFSSTRATIESLLVQIDALQVALNGVSQEVDVGARTVLDILDAQQELLNAQVDLVSARRDEVVAAFELLSAVGRMTALDLNLPVDIIDFDADYYSTRARWR